MIVQDACRFISFSADQTYPMIIKDDYSRRMWIYFLQRKSDAGNAFRNFLADVRADDFPSEVQVVRSDNGGKFSGEF